MASTDFTANDLNVAQTLSPRRMASTAATTAGNMKHAPMKTEIQNSTVLMGLMFRSPLPGTQFARPRHSRHHQSNYAQGVQRE